MNHETKDSKIQPERDKTDESLRSERKKTDALVIQEHSAVEESSVGPERARADAALKTARATANQMVDAAPTPAREAVAKERALGDVILQQERAGADERLDRERNEQALKLAALLPLERERTDRHLLTERARSDEAVTQRDDFMAMVSHDLRNLLSGVLLSATLIAEEASESDEGHRFVAGAERIQRYVARMNRLIGDLVDVVSIDAGKFSVRPERGDAGALITEAVEAFANAASEKGISLESGPVERSLLADFDHDRMLQVLANLLTNALKFTPRGGRIAVRGGRVGDETHLSVSDTGAGIPGNMLEAVFERFWQVGKNDRRGLGLGLYISRCIVDAHRGKIWVESKLGEGSVFHVDLPTASRTG
jgi:signal transduction histidine kinase